MGKDLLQILYDVKQFLLYTVSHRGTCWWRNQRRCWSRWYKCWSLMRVYSVWAFLKAILWLWILTILYHYVSVDTNAALWLWFWFLGVFLVVWWVWYYFFLVLWKIFSKAEHYIKTSASYKLSLFLGVFVIVNLTFMIIDKWTNTIGILLIIVFLALQYFVTTEFHKKQLT